MLRLCLLLCLLISSSLALGQNLQHIWSHGMGDGEGEDDESNAMCTDAAGNLYVAGIFEGSIDFNPAPSQLSLLGSVYSDDGYVAKFDSSGGLVWVKHIETLSSIKINEIELDHSGNIVIAGYFSNRIDFDPSPDTSYAYSGTFNNANGFVAKYSNSGNLIWGINIGGTNVDNATCLAIDPNNNVLVAGAFSDTVDFNPGMGTDQQIASAAQDIFVAKYDSTGKYEWAFSVHASSNDYAQKMDVDSKGDIVVAGTFSNTADFDAGSNTANLSPNGRNDAFIAKYTSNGNYKWARTIGGSGNEYVYGMEISSSDFIYLTGTFESTADFDPSSSTASVISNGREDIYFAKYEPSGDYVWAKGIGTSSAEVSNAMTLDADGSSYITGYFVAQTDFDPSAATANLTPSGGDIYIAKYDSAGNYDWAFQLGDGNFETGLCLAVDPYNKFWAGGYFTSTVDFDPGTARRNLSTPSTRNNSSFFAKYQQSTGAYDTALVVQDRLGGNDAILDLYHDSKGNVYATGYFEGGVDFDPSSNVAELNANGGFDVFVAKYDSLGNYQWAFNLGSTLDDLAYEITVDQKDNIYITGYFNDTMDLDPSSALANIVSAGSTDIFLAKYDATGSYLWGYGIGGISTDEGYGLATDSANNVWLTGYFRSTVDFDPSSGITSLSARNRDAFLTKYDQYGRFKFAKFIGGSSNNFGHALVNGSNNSLYLAGEFRNTCDFDPSTNTANLSTSGTADPFIAKYDSLGRFIWAKGLNGSGTDRPTDIDLDGKENIYISGFFQRTIDLDASSNTANFTALGGDDAFVASYDSSGAYRWAHSFGSNTTRNERALALDVQKSVLSLTGYFSDTVDFNPSATEDSLLVAENNDNPYLLQLDTAGLFLEAGYIHTLSGYGYAIAAFGKKLYAGGSFQVEADMNPSPTETARITARGSSDIFIGQYGFVNVCKATTASISANVCGPYEAPSGAKFYHRSGTYVDTLVNAEGCDSLITIHLSIRNTFSTLRPIVCDSFKAPSGRVFFASGTYSDTIANYGNCDSIITIELRVAKNHVQIARTVCDTFYAPSGKHQYSSSGTYLDTLTNQFSCDSILEIVLTVHKSSNSTVHLDNCDSIVSPSGKYTYTTSGTYTDTLINWTGCDSIVTVNATVFSTKRSKINRSACGSYTSPSQRFTYTASGTYLDTLQTANNCDSIIEIELTLRQPSSASLSTSSCDSFVSPSGKYIYKQSGFYLDTLINTQGCDSVIALQLTIHSSTRNNIQVSACGTYTSPSLRYTYTSSGTYFDTLQTTSNCDSIIEIELTLHQASSGSIKTSSCDSFISPSGKYRYRSSGIYLDTLTNAQGCDSVITIHFKRLLASRSNRTVETCRSLTSPSGNYTYTLSGVYTDTVSNFQGCDSIITIDLSILEPIDSLIIRTACDTYTSPSGKYRYQQSGIYQDTLTSYKGCDSVVTIDLTLINNQPNISFSNNTLLLDLPGLSYQWLDCDVNFAQIDTATRQQFEPRRSGNYTAVVYEAGCADTAACLEVVIVGIDPDLHSQVSVYPNPAKDLLFVESKQAIRRLNVYSVEGKLLIEATKTNQVSLETLAPSIYFIQIETANGLSRFRFVKD